VRIHQPWKALLRRQRVQPRLPRDPPLIVKRVEIGTTVAVVAADAAAVEGKAFQNRSTPERQEKKQTLPRMQKPSPLP
jgi:hypothetical protein